ncbi:MAG: dihydroorotase family protein [Candidatus Doudnabacteria bacterium]|nr:dihydroorotase family protein [Candidatus Doudnabacteria bacterium]
MYSHWQIINVILPSGQRSAIQIKDRLIEEVGQERKGLLPFLDAKGLHVVPGLINPHVHFRTPGEEHKEDWVTGTAAALAGGCTTVGDMPNNKIPCTTVERLVNKIKTVGEQALNARFWMAGMPDNISEIRDARFLKPPLLGVKVYFDLSTGGLIVREQKDRIAIAEKTREGELVYAVHAESERIRLRNESMMEKLPRISDHCIIRSAESEIEAVKKAIEVQRCTGVKMLICHVSHPTSVELILLAKDRGQEIYIEGCPHYLFLTSHLLDRIDGAFFKMNPPLRDPKEAELMLDYVCRGDVDIIDSDHAPHTQEEKIGHPYDKTPSGVPGVQDLFSLMYSLVAAGRMTIGQFIELTSTNAAKLFGMKKGALAPGYDADLVLFDPAAEVVFRNEEQLTKSAWSPFALAGLRGMGRPKVVINRGQIVYRRADDE